MGKTAVAFILVLTLASDRLRAEENLRGPHGGQWLKGTNFQAEFCWQPDRVRIYLYDRSGKELPVKNMRGLLLLTLPKQPRTTRLNLDPANGGETAVNVLQATIDLKGIPPGQAKVECYFCGFAKPIARQARVSARLRLLLDPVQVAIARQRICPISSKPLGSMGKPASLGMGGRTIYFCCEPCADVFKEAPKKYLRILKAQ